MTETEERAFRRLQGCSEETHVDALRHPDPSGAGLLTLLRGLEHHASASAAETQACATLAGETSDPSVAEVLRLVVADKQRERQIYDVIERGVRQRLQWAHSNVNARAARAECETGWCDRMRKLEADEHCASRALRDLAYRAREEGESLAQVLLESMAVDAEKRASLLRYVAHRVG